MRLWWDPTTLANGSVSSWTDRVSSIAAIQASGPAQPTKSATAISGAYPGVTGDGGDLLVANLAAFAGKTVMTVVAAMTDASAAVGLPWELSANVIGIDGAIASNCNSAAGTVAAYARGTAGFSARTAPNTLATPVVVSMIFDLSVAGAGAVVAIRINGVAQSLTNVGTASAAGSLGAHSLFIFARTGPAFGWTGTFGHYVWRESAAQDAGLDSLERFVGARAGITW